MKIRQDFIIHNRDSESLLVSTGSADFNGLVRGNRIFGEIMDLMREDTTEDEVVRALLEKYDAPEEKIRSDVRRVVTELKGIGAIDE